MIQLLIGIIQKMWILEGSNPRQLSIWISPESKAISERNTGVPLFCISINDCFYPRNDWLLHIDNEESKQFKQPLFNISPEDTLKERQKGCLLDFSEKLWIYHLYSNNKLTPDEIYKGCFVSYSTIQSIIKKFARCSNSMRLATSIRSKKNLKLSDCENLNQ